MRKIIYYVATSIDGFIAGLDDDISGFVPSGNGVDQYLQDLQAFDTVIMGRKTYEFGYQYGLKAGQPAYPHMEHFIFSQSLTFDQAHEKVHVCPLDIDLIKALKRKDQPDIYLCGGGVFAGWLLDHELIDQVKIKLNPLILGAGIPLFGTSKKQFKLELMESKRYDLGLQIMNYQINYNV